jgi:hypothetical protein
MKLTLSGLAGRIGAGPSKVLALTRREVRIETAPDQSSSSSCSLQPLHGRYPADLIDSDNFFLAIFVAFRILTPYTQQVTRPTRTRDSQ